MFWLASLKSAEAGCKWSSINNRVPRLSVLLDLLLCVKLISCYLLSGLEWLQKLQGTHLYITLSKARAKEFLRSLHGIFPWASLTLDRSGAQPWASYFGLYWLIGPGLCFLLEPSELVSLQEFSPEQWSAYSPEECLPHNQYIFVKLVN